MMAAWARSTNFHKLSVTVEENLSLSPRVVAAWFLGDPGPRAAAAEGTSGPGRPAGAELQAKGRGPGRAGECLGPMAAASQGLFRRLRPQP